MRAREIMTTNLATVSPDDRAQRAAELMAEYDCGCVPVVEAGGRVVGVVTDRDLAIRGLAHGRGADTPVRELMTAEPECCDADADLHEVERIMRDSQLRRVVVVDADHRCIGIVAQADLARAAEEGRGVSDTEVARVVERISEPPSMSLDQRPSSSRADAPGAREWRL